MEIKQQIDNIRKEGFRPGIVGVFINDNKVLLLNKVDWKLWLFSQGGVDNNETPKEALTREMTEELGAAFVATWVSEPEFIFEDRITLPEDLNNSRSLTTDDGTAVKMLGKHYFYYVVKTTSQELAITETEFDNYKWLTFDEAVELSTTIYQKNKRKALIKVLNLLLQKGYIS